MRGFASSFRRAAAGLCALASFGCGPKAPPPSDAQADVDVVLLEVTRQIPLSSPASPLGRNLHLAASPTGDWFVLDTDHHRVLHYDAQGNLRREVGGLGTGPLEFDTPVDIDADGLSVWILDRQNRRLVRLSLDLNYIEEMPVGAAADDYSGTLWYDALALTSSGDLLLLDRREPKVERLSPSGDILASYGGFGLGSGRLENPADLAAASSGDVYVADGRRIRCYDRAGNYRGAAVTPAPVTTVAGGDNGAWGLLASGDLCNVSRDLYRQVTVDPARGKPVPVAVTFVRGQGPAILDAGLRVWLLAPFDR
jgi:DNA-binding beta-propeller fold protein YncE